MKSIKSRYELLDISGDTSISVNDSPGYIWLPYIIQPSPTIICEGDAKYWIRISQIRKRREKIEKIMNKINGPIHN
jgi:hypothetical protein